ncbi:hypothetical protein [Actinomycetospora sp. TBRC 11914]|uniref:hypothetical protein n=1 Tax=Actinomycetospora sp. TBRC 11914 TaxID=2729387 RepID=UPI00145C6CE1|nr:hypothetical protein [Actinomycetospora sp. TBRC 11914]NMO92956.1 MFS transporter [Actinomycetospora sp. TBRC 11914]
MPVHDGSRPRAVVLSTDVAEVFPLGLRGLGSGIANGAGRSAGVVGGVLVAAISTGLGTVAVHVHPAATARPRPAPRRGVHQRPWVEEISADALAGETSDV